MAIAVNANGPVPRLAVAGFARVPRLGDGPVATGRGARLPASAPRQPTCARGFFRQMAAATATS